MNTLMSNAVFRFHDPIASSGGTIWAAFHELWLGSCGGALEPPDAASLAAAKASCWVAVEVLLNPRTQLEPGSCQS
jgi:hypothetical protein